MRMTCIVIGYVPNAQGDAALEWGLTASVHYGHRVVVVNTAVQDASDLADPHRTQLAALGDRLRQHGEDDELRTMPFGSDPAEHLLEVAQEVDASLVVIGLRRRSSLGKAVFGSTAQQVLLNAPCPVVAVKA